jgi:hypothetical protein
MQSALECRPKLHIAIIMDGNGRWATARGLARTAGHRAGVETVRRVCEAAPDLGVTTLTLFAFSADNWRRPPAEVGALMGLLRLYLRNEVAKLIDNGTRLSIIGRRDRLPGDLAEDLADAEGVDGHLVKGPHLKGDRPAERKVYLPRTNLIPGVEGPIVAAGRRKRRAHVVTTEADDGRGGVRGGADGEVGSFGRSGSRRLAAPDGSRGKNEERKRVSHEPSWRFDDRIRVPRGPQIRCGPRDRQGRWACRIPVHGA